VPSAPARRENSPTSMTPTCANSYSDTGSCAIAARRGSLLREDALAPSDTAAQEVRESSRAQTGLRLHAATRALTTAGRRAVAWLTLVGASMTRTSAARFVRSRMGAYLGLFPCLLSHGLSAHGERQRISSSTRPELDASPAAVPGPSAITAVPPTNRDSARSAPISGQGSRRRNGPSSRNAW